MAAEDARTRGDCDVAMIERSFGLLIEPGATFEVRALGKDRGRDAVWSGYFVDGVLASRAVPAVTRGAVGVYYTLNPVQPALRARCKDRIQIAGKNATTGDQHIVKRARLLIDIDAERPSGISSSDIEHRAAIDVAQEMSYELGRLGWPDPLVADSGNGGHLVYGIDLPTDDEGLVKRVLETMAGRWNCKVGEVALKVDTTVANPARISKLYGTYTRKGDDVDDRAHRMATILSAPDRLVAVSRQQLEEFAGPVVVTKPAATRSTPSSGPLPTLDVSDWLGRYGLEVKQTKPNQDGGTVYELAVCPWNSDHANGEAFVIQRGSGAIVAGCHHESCRWDWTELRERYEPRDTRPRASAPSSSGSSDWHPHAPVEQGGLPSPLTVIDGGRGKEPEPTAKEPPTPGTWDYDLAVALDDIRRALTTKTSDVREPLFGSDIVDILGAEFTETQWLVTGLITKGGVTMIGAEPKAAKTWLGTEIALAIATGTKVCGEFFAQLGRVAYFYAEDMKRQIRNRVRALLAGHGRTIERGRFHPEPRGKFLDITRDEDLAWVVASCRRKFDGLDVLVLDPLRDLHSGEEDKSDSMRNVMRRLRVLGELLGCTVVVVHHSVKMGVDTAKRRPGQRLRGSSAIHGSIDSGIYLSHAESDSPNVLVNEVDSEMKGAGGAGGFTMTLTVEDDTNGEAISAEWSIKRVSKKDKAEALKNAKAAKRDADRQDSIVSYLRSVDGPAAKNTICKEVKGDKTTVLKLINDLITKGVLAYKDGGVALADRGSK